MSHVLGPRSWIFWWAGLTSMAFLQDWLRGLAAFFRSDVVFSPNIPPFNLVPGVNSWIDQMAETIRTTIKFNPNGVLLSFGSFAIQNWAIAVLLGILILLLAGWFYSRALATSALLDDFLALIVLYFVIRIEAHLVSLANILGLSGAARSFLSNPLAAFVILMFFLIGLAVTGEGLRSPRSFWRGLLEALLVGILLFPADAGRYIAMGIDTLAGFGTLLRNNVSFSLVWGVVGLVLALRRLYYVDVQA